MSHLHFREARLILISVVKHLNAIDCLSNIFKLYAKYRQYRGICYIMTNTKRFRLFVERQLTIYLWFG